MTIYYATLEEGFSQDKTLEFQLQYQDTIHFELPKEATSLRIDLSELPSFYQRVSLSTTGYQTELLPSFFKWGTLSETMLCSEILILN